MTKLRVVTYAIDDALTGERLEGGFFSEKLAEGQLKKVRRKFPSAFVIRVEPS